MGIVIVIRGLVFVVYPNDHQPPHCHAVAEAFGAKAVIELPSCEVIISEGFDEQMIDLIEIIAKQRKSDLINEWETQHGKLKKK